MRHVSGILLLCVLALVAFGMVMLASASGVRAMELHGDPMYFVKRQLIWLLVAVAAGGFAIRMNYQFWRALALPVYLLAVVMLILVFVPGMGVRAGGSWRWVRLGNLRVQPSEFAKFALVAVSAWWLARERLRIKEFGRGTLAPMMLMGIPAGLIFIEPDFGTAALCAIVAMSVMFAGGARLRYLFLFAFTGLSGFCVAVMHNPIRMNRVLAFLRPEEYAQTYSFQLVNAINAFVAGGLRGVGLAASMQKHYYLPEAHTDFIFAIIGEELGLTATLSVLILFAAITVCGILISLKAPDTFGRLLAFGLTMLLTVQALFNVGVVTGCLPTKGLTLPFISSGGSSLVMSLFVVGVLLNIARQTDLSVGTPAWRRGRAGTDY